MSVKIMSLVWERAPYSEGSLLVLLALADWADDTGVAWPSIPTLAHKARLQRRRVQYIVRKLQSDGILDIEEGGGRTKQHRYSLNLEKLKGALNAPYVENTEVIKGALNAPFTEKGALDDIERVHFETERVHSETQTVHSSAPDPLEEPLEDPPIDPLDSTALFLFTLKNNPAYSHVDLDREVFKMQAWLALPANKGRKLTSRFILHWLNKIDRPLTVASPNGNGHHASYKPNDAKEVCLRCHNTGTERTPKGSRPCDHKVEARV